MKEGPSRTAEATCAFRAVEHRRPAAQRIVEDPYALDFLRPRDRRWVEGIPLRLYDAGEWVLEGLATFVLVRHAWLDALLLESLGDVEQVVVLGAGYDTRAWRFAKELDGRPLFEVDHPATGERKAACLADLPWADKAPSRRVIPQDLREADWGDQLVAKGFTAGLPTLFIWEGVSMYLTEEAVLATLSVLRALGGPGSRLGMDLWHQPKGPGLRARWHRLSPHLLSAIGEPVLFGLAPAEAPDFFAGAGTPLLEYVDAAGLQARFVTDGRSVLPTMSVARISLG